MTDTDDTSFGMGGPYRLDPEEEAYYARREQFVREWREAHRSRMWLDPWLCDLCKRNVQTAVTDDPAQDAAFHRFQIAEHKRWHGDDYRDLMALAAAPEDGATGGDR